MAAESLHKIGGLNLVIDSILQGDIRDMSTEEVSQLCPLGGLILNHGLDVLSLLLSAVLPSMSSVRRRRK